MGDGLRADLSGLGLELKLVDKRFAAAVRKNVRAAVTEAGAGILGKVRANASWSTKIPAATKLSTSFGIRSAGITIRTGARRAPNGRPLEFGSKGNPGVNRHPVFGRGGWANQPTRPFFFSAVEAMTPETEAAFRAAIDRAVREAGFH